MTETAVAIPKFAGTPETFPELTTLPDVRVVPIVRLAFYFYVATIPFETVNLGVPIELTQISFALLLLSMVFQVPLCIRKPPAAFVCFLLYTAVFVLPVVTDETPFGAEASWQTAVLLQLVLMCWVSLNLMKSEGVARTAIITFAMSCGLLALLQLAGVSETTTNFEESIQRTTSFGFHPNNLARILSLGLLVFIGMTYGGVKDPIRSRTVAWLMFMLIGVSIVETGSRGGLLAFFAGLSVLILRQGDIRAKIRNAAVLVTAGAALTFIVFESDLFRSRIERAMDDGDLARREVIYPTAWEMFLEKPLVGWGGKGSEFELGARLAHEDEISKNPHNLFLYILVATGVVGAVPMLIGLVLCGFTAWRARNGPRDILPLSLFATVMVANMSGLWLHNKMHWFVIAYVLSSASVFFLRKVRAEEESDGRFVGPGRARRICTT